MKLKTLAAGAAATAAVIVSSPAFAAGPPYTVSVGGSSASATHSFYASSVQPVQLTIRNNAGTTINASCTTVSAGGWLTAGPNVDTLITITNTTWFDCRSVGGRHTMNQAGSWSVIPTGTATTGVESVPGYLTTLNATSSVSANPNACSYRVSGMPRAAFSEAAQQLVISETGFSHRLELSNVVGCLGQLQNNNPVNMVATLEVLSPSGAIDLS